MRNHHRATDVGSRRQQRIRVSEDGVVEAKLVGARYVVGDGGIVEQLGEHEVEYDQDDSTNREHTVDFERSTLAFLGSGHFCLRRLCCKLNGERWPKVISKVSGRWEGLKGYSKDTIRP